MLTCLFLCLRQNTNIYLHNRKLIFQLKASVIFLSVPAIVSPSETCYPIDYVTSSLNTNDSTFGISLIKASDTVDHNIHTIVILIKKKQIWSGLVSTTIESDAFDTQLLFPRR